MNAAPRSTPLLQQTNAAPDHLTDDQLDDYLIGDVAAPAAGHLAGCALCTARVAEAAALMSSFRAVSLAWSERQSAATPMPTMAPAHRQWQRSLAWSLAVAACAAGLGFVSAARHAAAPSEGSQLSETAYADQRDAPSADQISSDNLLLKTIDHEISTSNENSATLGLMPVNSSRTSAGHAVLIGTSVQD